MLVGGGKEADEGLDMDSWKPMMRSVVVVSWFFGLAVMAFASMRRSAVIEKQEYEYVHVPASVLSRDLPLPSFNAELETVKVKYAGGVMHMKHFQHNSSRVTVVAVHGWNKKSQNVQHWNPILGLFAKLGSFYLVDLPGHGQSLPQRKNDEHDAANGLFVALEGSGLFDERNELIFVARSWGSRVVLRLLRSHPSIKKRTSKLIFIAPNIRPKDRMPNLSSTKSMFVWGEKDKVAPVRQARRIMKNGSLTSTLVVFGNMASHSPELEKPGHFAQAVENFVSH